MKRSAPDPGRIIPDPTIMVGKPVVRGTRIPVEHVLAHLAANPDVDELFAAYPRLTPEGVQAGLAYACNAVEDQRERQKRAVAPVPPATAG